MFRKIIVFFFIILINVTYAQTEIFDQYPPGQFFYDKGELNFLRDLQKAAKENNVQPCENKDEEYLAKWVVYPDSTIKFIKDPDTLNIQKNKCAFDFTKEVFKYLDGWKPLHHENKNYAVIASYKIVPNEIFKYNIDSSLILDYKKAQYPGGNTSFDIGLQSALGPIFNKYEQELRGQSITVFFKITKEGNMKDINITHPIFFRIKDDVLRAFKNFKKWKPALKNGVPMESNYHLSIRFES